MRLTTRSLDPRSRPRIRCSRDFAGLALSANLRSPTRTASKSVFRSFSSSMTRRASADWLSNPSFNAARMKGRLPT